MQLTSTDIRERVDRLDWADLRSQLDDRGHAVTSPLLDDAECDALRDLFDTAQFRSTIDMARHRFGEGRYRYFDHPLPEPIADLRRLLPPPGADRERLGGAAARRRRCSRPSTRSCSSDAAPPARPARRR